jgi:hypothetical protein
MKIRKHRQREWIFHPYEESSLPKSYYKFKYKSKLHKFINCRLDECIGGTVRLTESNMSSSFTIREWFVWYNERSITFKPDLRQLLWRGRKYITKPNKISKTSKKYFAFSDKVINLMSEINNDLDKGINISPRKANKLYNLFIKRGFKDFEPSEQDKNYINYYIENGIPFWYWSDRCNTLRMKTIIEYFKRNKLI